MGICLCYRHVLIYIYAGKHLGLPAQAVYKLCSSWMSEEKIKKKNLNLICEMSIFCRADTPISR